MSEGKSTSWKVRKWFYLLMASCIPPEPVGSVVKWCEQNVKLIGSARSENYKSAISPWTIEPLECADNGTRKMTFVKPVQTGGSAVGECAICYWIATQNAGDIQYNWQSDLAADQRWTKRFERILKACPAVMARAPGDRHKWTKGLIAFPHLNFIMQGVFTDRNVASDSICRQVNEELHDEEGGWTPGRLEQATGRLKAYWNSVQFNISNAGKKDGQLHKAFLAGTQQTWTVKCPGCGLYHSMRTRWEETEPHLGGLRYDADGCRRKDGSYDYFKLQSSVRFQMPCGAIVREDLAERRALSLSGKYSEPVSGAGPGERSYTLEAVSIDYIPWLDLIKQKHKALFALKYGDPKPWDDYLREAECQFASDESRPVIQKIILSTQKKDRAGLPGRICRLGMFDRQQGTIAIGETPHWWGVIWDAEILPDGRIHVLILFEGKILSDEDLVRTLKRHEVEPRCVVCDSGWDTMHVYQFCMANGYSAIKGEDSQYFPHPDGGKKIFSKEKPLHTMFNQAPKHDYILLNSKTREYIPDPDEPLFWFYSKTGIMERLAWMRTSPMVWFDVPADVSDDFIKHMDSWSCQTRKNSRTGEIVQQWRQHKKRDDLYFCCCYGAMLLEMAGVIGAGALDPDAKPETK